MSEAPEQAPRKRRRLSAKKKLAFAVTPFVLFFVVGELGVRIARGKLLDAGDARAVRRDLLRSAYPADWHEQLGYVPKANTSGKENVWGTTVTIDADTLRANGPPTDGLKGAPILAVGDSFTFGDQVSDTQTWPAHLERTLNRRVLNGGVFGYGFDQTSLRAAALLEEHQAGVLLVSVIPDDIRRCELSRWNGAWKPYFQIESEELVLKGVPVPEREDEDATPILARSHLLDAIFHRLAPRMWGSGRKKQTEHREGLAVSKHIVEALKGLALEREIPLLLIGQGPRGWKREALEALLDHARASGVAVLDLHGEQEAIFAEHPEREAEWFDGHMTDAGNAWVAGRIADELKKRGW